MPHAQWKDTLPKMRRPLDVLYGAKIWEIVIVLPAKMNPPIRGANVPGPTGKVSRQLEKWCIQD